ncbi:MAG: signal recognition particle protein [Candidatus Babeliales bacterium]|nr:signal recognition particle protein [Candidatus Babeliales bacterium]
MFDFLTKKFSSIFSKFSGNTRITQDNIQEALDQVKDSLLEADVPLEVINDFIEKVKVKALGLNVSKSLNPGEQFIKIVYQEICDFLGGANFVTPSFQIPSVIMVMGLQGSGKTTTVSKIAHFLKDLAAKKGKPRNILLASVDFYRPAAIDQLEILAKQVGVDFYRSNYDKPVQAASDIFKKFKNGQYDYLLLDTAGRLHVDSNMLQELKDIDTNLEPKYKILVLDSMTGQESLRVAKAFDQVVGFNSAILTKIDSDTRGGSAFAFKYMLKKPIIFLGSGEKVEDLELFYPDRMANRILGMGDMLSLIERAEAQIKQDDKERVTQNFASGNFSLEDFADQLKMMGKIGSLSKIVQYLPGMGNLNMTPEMVEKSELEIKKFKAMISSMTLKERVYPKVLDASRRERIVKGSGTSLKDLNLLLERFEQSKQFAKLFNKKGGFKGMFK